MSVLIKGMEMPTNCEECPLSDSLHCQVLPSVPALWAEYTNAIREKRLHSECPLVPVQKHGRLIDADALDKAFTGLRWDNNRLAHWGDRKDWCLFGSEIEALISAAPTIIPAEEAT